MNKEQAALAEETMQYIESFPDEHNQQTWVNSCGTAFCFAGMAVRIAHPDWYFEIVEDWNGKRITNGTVLNENRDPVGTVKEVAQRDLGLDWNQANSLFSGGNTLSHLRRMVDRLTAHAE